MKHQCSPHTRAVVAFSIFAITTVIPCLSVGRTHSLTNIRQVDFLNFTYSSSCADGPSARVRVIDGSFLARTNEETVSFEVLDVKYGDLTGDGKEEAVVLTLCSTGGSLSATWGYIYTLRNNAPVLLAEVEGGDRANGGIHREKIANRLLEVIRNDGGGPACCPEFVKATKYRLSNNRLVPVGQSIRSKIGSNDDLRRERIRFARGRTSTILRSSAIQGDEYIISAQAGQSLILHLSSQGGNAELRVSDFNGNNLADSATNNSFNGRLPATGDYIITVRATRGIADYVLEVTVPALR